MSQLKIMKAEINTRNLARWSAERSHSDPDRAMHCLVAETFGTDNPLRPFVVRVDPTQSPGTASLLAYTSLDADVLRANAETMQTLALQAVLNPDTIRTTTVPDQWTPGSTVDFEVRLKPTRRSSASPEHGGNHEKDAFNPADTGGTREQAYIRWLAENLERRAGMTIVPGTARMTRYAQRRVKRQKHGKWVPTPDATIKGVGAITEPHQFQELLRQGIGRQRSYGYGMLLIRPVQTLT